MRPIHVQRPKNKKVPDCPFCYDGYLVQDSVGIWYCVVCHKSFNNFQSQQKPEKQ